MKIEYFGHSFWGLFTEDCRIVIDPFDFIGYPLPENLSSDYVFISHDHHDHNNIALIKNNPQVINTPGEFTFSGLQAKLIPVFHDDVSGAKRGKNNIIKLISDDLTIVHCGDLGHVPVDNIINQIEKPDVLMIPVGEVYTISLPEVWNFIEMIKPKLILPMHYNTPYLKFNLGHLENFTKRYQDIVYLDEKTIEINPYISDKQKIVIFNWTLKV